MVKSKVRIRSLGVVTAFLMGFSPFIVGCGHKDIKGEEENIKGRQLLAELEKGKVYDIERRIEKHLGSSTSSDDMAKDDGDFKEGLSEDLGSEDNTEGTEDNEYDEQGDKENKDKSGETVDIYSKDYNLIFEDTIFMGDSISEGLYYMEVIDESRVVAAMGATILNAKEELSKVVSLVPKKVVLLYGMNDVILFDETNEWTSMESFKANYKELLQTLKNQLPYAEIYVQSPLSVAEGNLNASPRLTNDNLDNLRQAVKEVCEEVNVNYVDINKIVEGDKTLRADDGIHLKHDFYIQWMNLLEKEMKN